MNTITGLQLPYLQHRVKEQLPTAPTPHFENLKIYKTIKGQLEALYDAEFNVQLAARHIEVALNPMGMNYHFFNLMAGLYGKLFKAIKEFEKLLNKAPKELKEYYQNLTIPSSSDIYPQFKVEMDILLPLAANELQLAKDRNPNWTTWDECILDWDTLNQKYKEGTK